MKGFAARLRWWRIALFHRLFPGAALRRNLARKHEHELEMRVLAALCDKNRISIDVGANAGTYTGALLPISAGVIAIEPHPRLARLLRAFPPDRVDVREAVVSRRGGQTMQLEVDLVHHREADALGRVGQAEAGPGTRRFPVRSVALDDFANLPVGFVKIDVEGHELEALAGAVELIARQQPIFLVEAETRMRAEAPEDVFDWFSGHQYSGFFLHDDEAHPVSEYVSALQDEANLLGYVRREDAHYVNNFIFVPPGRDLPSIMAACENLLARDSLTIESEARPG